MMLSVNLKDSVLTTQSSTNFIDSKSKITKEEYFYEKRVCIVLLVGRSKIVELVFSRKNFPCLVLHQTVKTLMAVIFSSGRLLHPPSTVLPICLRTARARPAKILRAVTFLKNVLDFNPRQ